MSQQPQPMGFAPVPVNTDVALAGDPNGNRIVVLRACTPVFPGGVMLGLTAEHAMSLAEQLAQAAQQARSPGLVVAQPAQMGQALAVMARRDGR